MKKQKFTNLTIAEQKKLKTRLKAKRKIELAQIAIQEQKEKQYKFDMYLAEKQELKKQQVTEQNKLTLKENIILELRKNNPFSYRQFLIIYDMLNNNFYQIETDFNQNKITKEDITKILDYLKSWFYTIDKGYLEFMN